MTVRKTKSGWVIEITHMVNGMYEQGGISGREWLYTRATLAKLGIGYDADPQADDICEDVSNEAYLRNCVEPDRVLKKGHTIL